MEWVGKAVRKEIEGVGLCSGTVRSHDSSRNFENGVTEVSESADLAMGEGGSQAEQPRAGRRRTGTRSRGEIISSEVNVMRNVDLNDDGVAEDDSRVSDDCFGGNVDLNCGPVEKTTLGLDLNRAFDLSTGLDLNLNDGLGLVNVSIDYEEGSSVKRRGFIDLNMDARCDLSPHKEVGGFDLNLEVNMQDDEQGIQNSLEGGECKEVHVAEVSSVQLFEEIGKQDVVSLQDLNTPERDLEHEAKTVVESLSDREEYTSGRRKRRKASVNPKFTSQPRLRRSARRPLARFSNTACLADEVSPSPSVSSLTEEKTWVVEGKAAEDLSVPPPKAELPPSSRVLNLDGLPILNVFSVYSCLRSFSALLFLSPFELEDFVEALRCMSPSLLFDSIHVSVLQILRKHLENLVAEGDWAAIACLRYEYFSLFSVIWT